MTAIAAVHRIIRIPNSFSGVAGNVRADILANVRPYGAVVETQSNDTVLRIEVVLTTTQDATLVALMPTWAARLGVAQLDTTSASVMSGH